MGTAWRTYTMQSTSREDYNSVDLSPLPQSANEGQNVGGKTNKYLLSGQCNTCVDTCATKGGDSDGDGICNKDDNCDTVANPDQNDSDGDGIGDACDNCVAVSNSDQTNSDTDTLGDACDNCDLVANQDQIDVNPANGVGDACENGGSLCTDLIKDLKVTSHSSGQIITTSPIPVLSGTVQ